MRHLIENKVFFPPSQIRKGKEGKGKAEGEEKRVRREVEIKERVRGMGRREVERRERIWGKGKKRGEGEKGRGGKEASLKIMKE